MDIVKFIKTDGLNYFIMQSDMNRQKVEELAAMVEYSSLHEILTFLHLTPIDFTDSDYKLLVDRVERH